MSEMSIENIGDAPSAIDRQIEDGSQFDKYFPPIDGKVKLLKKNGNVDDTVKLMTQMERDFCYQTEQIAKVLAVYSNGKLDVEKTAKAVWDFVVKYIKYNIEPGEQLQTPAHTWYQAQILARKHPENGANSADCDCMTIFCGCIFRNLGIPHSFRIAGYANSLGISRGYQHVYVIVHHKGKDIPCDPVFTKFNAEKETAIEKDYSMGLSGTDIYCLSGMPNNIPTIGLTYVEQPDGSLGLLGGKRKAKKAEKQKKKVAKKQAKQDKKAAKKEVKSARKELKAAKKSGNTQAIAAAKKKKEAAKQKKQNAKERIDANRTGIAKAVSKTAKAVKNTSLALPRGAFLVLMRLNFRGIARKFSNNQAAYDKFARIWKNLGGKTAKLKKAIDKGKNKKALFGSKSNADTQLQVELDGLGYVLGEYGILPTQIGTLGEPVTVAVSSAIASATPIIKKVMDVIKEVGEFIPESADESEDASPTYEESYEEAEEPEYDDDEYDESDYEEDDEDEEEYEEMSGCDISGDGCYYIDNVAGLGTLGKGLFKKVAGKAATLLKKRKEKKAAGKAKKSGENKNGLLSKMKTKRAAKKAKNKESKNIKKANRKAKSTQKAEQKKAKKTERKARRESGDTLLNRAKAKVKSVTEKATNNKAMQKAMSYSTGLKNDYNMDNTSSTTMQTTTAKQSFFKEHKTPLIIGGSVLLLTVLGFAFKDKIFGGGSVSGYEPIELE